MAAAEMWTWRDPRWTGIDLIGFEVEAPDGRIGKVDEAAHDAGASYLVVNARSGIFGRKVLLPAGVVDSIDIDDGHVFVERPKAEIYAAPPFDKDTYRAESYRTEVGGYYVWRRAQRDTALP